MKRLLALLLLLPFAASADGGFSISYRSMPSYVKDLSGEMSYDYIETAQVSFYLDDTLKGTSKTKNGYWETRYFVKEFEPPSVKFPVGRFIEREVEIGDATPDEVNLRNQWRSPEDKVSPVYSKRIWIPAEIKGSLPSWTNPNKGAGYMMEFTLGMGSLDNRLDVYYFDMLIGKRLFVIPKFLHVYGKIGPSVFAQNWHETPYIPYSDKRFINTNLGVVARVGTQISVLKGIKFFVDSEFRGYGPVLRSDWNSDVNLINKFPFTEKEIDEHYRSYKGNNGVESLQNLVKESLRFGIKFKF
tara:strand:- start:253 stop:1152 length:900 start_codon:yes stop_codon:yes gene_type:complete